MIIKLNQLKDLQDCSHSNFFLSEIAKITDAKISIQLGIDFCSFKKPQGLFDPTGNEKRVCALKHIELDSTFSRLRSEQKRMLYLRLIIYDLMWEELLKFRQVSLQLQRLEKYHFVFRGVLMENRNRFLEPSLKYTPQ